MKNRTTLFVILIFICIFGIVFTLPFQSADAAQPAQGFVTSTPGPDGRIMYTVVANDTCSSVAFQHGITVPQLRSYNTRLDDNCTLSIGQQIVVGLVQPDLGPTPGPAPTLTLPTITATPFNGTTEICVLLFDDVNGDAIRQDTEFGIDGGAVSVTNLDGSYSQTQNTTAAVDSAGDPIRTCFSENVPAGDYNISMAVPDGYNPTMLLTSKITVKAGDRASVDFGAQSKTEAAAAPVEQTGSRTSSLGWFGLLLLLGGLGLAYFAYRSGQPSSKLKGSPLDRR